MTGGPWSDWKREWEWPRPKILDFRDWNTDRISALQLRGTDRNLKNTRLKTDPQTVSGWQQRGNEWGIEIGKGLIWDCQRDWDDN